MSYPPGPYEGSPEWQGQQPPAWQPPRPAGWQVPQPGWPPQHEPDNYLVWAMLCTFLCCVPLGIVSIVYSNKVSQLWAQGRYAEAQAAAENAKKWAIIGAVVAGVFWVIMALSLILLYLLGFAAAYEQSTTTTTTTFSGY